ncbi:MAG: hypothetical protein IPM82_10890 [Saprospiraceae bacterium]|nr:hypothetical protein [Saprospiraceae bacterium]
MPLQHEDYLEFIIHLLAKRGVCGPCPFHGQLLHRAYPLVEQGADERHHPIAKHSIIKGADGRKPVVFKGGIARCVQNLYPVSVSFAHFQGQLFRAVQETRAHDRLRIQYLGGRTVHGVVGVHAGRHFHEAQFVRCLYAGVSVGMPLEQNILVAPQHRNGGAASWGNQGRRIVFAQQFGEAIVQGKHHLWPLVIKHLHTKSVNPFRQPRPALLERRWRDAVYLHIVWAEVIGQIAA